MVVTKALVVVWFPETASFQFHIPLTHLKLYVTNSIKIEVCSNGKDSQVIKVALISSLYTNMQVYY